MLDGHNLCYLKFPLAFDYLFIELEGMFLKPLVAYIYIYIYYIWNRNCKTLFFLDKTLIIENRFWIKGEEFSIIKGCYSTARSLQRGFPRPFIIILLACQE